MKLRTFIVRYFLFDVGIACYYGTSNTIGQNKSQYRIFILILRKLEQDKRNGIKANVAINGCHVHLRNTLMSHYHFKCTRYIGLSSVMFSVYKFRSHCRHWKRSQSSLQANNFNVRLYDIVPFVCIFYMERNELYRAKNNAVTPSDCFTCIVKQ